MNHSQNHTVAAPIESMEAVNSLQIATLLGAFSCLMDAFTPFQSFDGSALKGQEVDGGTKSAVEMSLIDICNRLSSIVKDDRRWKTKGAEDRARQEAAIRKAALQQINDQRATTAFVSSPASLMKPTLRRLEDGTCIAFIGSPDVPAEFIAGAGRTFNEALRDFNRQFAIPADQQNAGARRTPSREKPPAGSGRRRNR